METDRNMGVTKARRRLRTYQQEKYGNWRFKGLLLAAFTDPEVVGRAWPTNDRFLHERHKDNRRLSMEDNYIVPGSRSQTSAERALARDIYGKDALGEKVHRDKYFKDMLASEEGRRALLRGSDTELDTLWREELLTTVIEGASYYQVARESATVIPVDAKVGDHPRGAADVYAPKLAEGGRIETEMEDYDTVAYSCDKYGQGFAVTEEMVDHAQINAIERQVQFSGTACENSLNRRFINQLVDGVAGVNDVDTDQATPTLSEVQGINHGVGEIEGDNFPMPDQVIVNPEFKTLYFDEANIAQANFAGSDEALRQRVFDPIWGLEMKTMSDGAYDSGSFTWGWAANDERGAVVTNSNFVGIFMYQDISTKDFDDPIRDLVGGNARVWHDVQVLQPSAHCTLRY